MDKPSSYEKFKSASFGNAYKNSVEFIVTKPSWQEGDVIMDYGCGSGKLAYENLRPVAEGNSAKKIHGVDMSDKMVSFATENFKSPLIEFSVGNLMDESNWTFERESINKFVSCLVLCFVQDYRSFLEKVLALLKPGGQMVLVVPFAVAGGITNKLLSSDKWSVYKPKDRDYRAATWAYDIEKGPTDLRDALSQVGFKVLDYESEETQFSFQNARELCEFLDVVTAATNYIPEESKAEFMEDMTNLAGEYLKLPNINEKIDVDWKFVNILAEKPVVV